jgi:hypothetical protein
LRFLVALSSIVLVFGTGSADPIKKDKPPEFDKLAKEHAEKFWSLVKEAKLDDAIKMMDVPFLLRGGETQDDHSKFSREFAKGMPKEMELNVVEAVELAKMNEWLKKKEYKEYDAERLKKMTDHAGKEARAVILELKRNGELMKAGRPAFMLTKFVDGKPRIVGVGGND